MKNVDIYSYDTLSAYLSDALQKCFGQRATQAQIAKKLGYKSHRIIGMVLSGERPPSSDLLKQLAGVFGLTPNENSYLGLLLDLAKRQRRGLPAADILQKMHELRPKDHNSTQIDTDQFSYISDWYFLVLKRMVAMADFVEEPAVIRERLRQKVTTPQIRMAFETLQRLGFLQRDPQTKKLSPKVENLVTTRNVPSAAIRQHHRQMLNRATEALSEDSVEFREFHAMPLQFDRSRMREAKEFLDKMVDEFDAKFSSSSADAKDIAQLNVQFFLHTAIDGGSNDRPKKIST